MTDKIRGQVTDNDGWINQGRIWQFSFNRWIWVQVSDDVAGREPGTWCIWISMAPSWYAPETPIQSLQGAKIKALRMAATHMRSLSSWAEDEASRIAVEMIGINLK